MDARLCGTRLIGAHLSGTDFGGADLSGADLSGADLSGSYLRAQLLGTNLRGADLKGATLTALLVDADLRGADLSGCRVYGVSAWNVKLEEANQRDLIITDGPEPIYVADGRLSCQLYQRSADAFIGVPFNIACYALLTLMVAQVTGLEAGEFVHTLGDARLYRNHRKQAGLQLSRMPRPLPKLTLDPAVTDLFAFREGHFTLEGYDPHPYIKAEVVV